MTSTPAVYALITTHVFSCLALLGCSLAFWASERRRSPWWLGLGLALAAIRPVNAVPLVAVIVWARRAEWQRLAAAGATAIVLCAPFTVWAFVIDPRWPLDYIAMLHAYPVAGLIQFVYAAGPMAYLAALIALAALSLAIAAYRGSEADAAERPREHCGTDGHIRDTTDASVFPCSANRHANRKRTRLRFSTAWL